MRQRWMGWMLLSAAIVLTVLYHARNALATPSVGFTGTTLAVGRFGEISVFNTFIPPNSRQNWRKKDLWLSWQKTKGSSDLYVQDNTWAPGGSTGWHTHPGHNLIIVTPGTVTAYEGDDPECKPSVYTTGMGFVDPGGDHEHIIRNEGAVDAKTIAVQLIPAGQPRRIDVADPGNRTF